MFSHYFRMLSHVPRWAIIPKLRQQSVAEHSYYVSLYVAELVQQHHNDWDPQKKFQAVMYALIHDAAEARMGDWPGPVKRMLVDDDKKHAHEAKVLVQMGWSAEFVKGQDDIIRLVKVADLIDETFYIGMELAMGNSMLENVWNGVLDRLGKAMMRAGLPRIAYDAVLNEIRLMGQFDTPSNNDDVTWVQDEGRA